MSVQGGSTGLSSSWEGPWGFGGRSGSVPGVCWERPGASGTWSDRCTGPYSGFSLLKLCFLRFGDDMENVEFIAPGSENAAARVPQKPACKHPWALETENAFFWAKG